MICSNLWQDFRFLYRLWHNQLGCGRSQDFFIAISIKWLKDSSVFHTHTHSKPVTPLLKPTEHVGYCWILASLVLFLCVFGPVESLNIILTWSCPQSFTLHQLMSSPCPIGIRVTDFPPTILPTKGNNIKTFRVRWLGTKIEFSTRYGRHVSRTESEDLSRCWPHSRSHADKHRRRIEGNAL